MKKLIILVSALALSCAILAQDEVNKDAILDKVVALYNRDMQSASGRSRWHGKATKVLDAQSGVEIETYEDGSVFTNDLKRTAQQRVYDANQRLKTFTDAKGFPKKLAEARKANAFAKTNTVEVTVELTAGK